MGHPSYQASNAIVYVTYAAFVVMGTAVAWHLKSRNTTDFLSSNRTQTALPLALNFFASALGSGILFTYPEIATIAGVQGVVIYALASALPMLIFGFIGPIIRRKCPDGFVLTEWTRQRYGTIGMLYLSFVTLVTLFLYMVSELSGIGQVINLMSGLNDLPVIIVQCVVTTIYTSFGGFKISFLTDTIQGAMVMGLVVIATITIGATVDIKPHLIEESGLLKGSLIGWQLLYILPVAIFTNDFFLAQLWLRTFASKTDKDLKIGASIATGAILCVIVLVGCTGLIAVWSAAWPGDPPQAGSVVFFSLLDSLPNWVVGIVLVMVVCLSTSAFDSIQSAMVSTASNDLFRNRLNIWVTRALVVVVIIPVIVIALQAPSILQIYLVSDLVSAATVPVLCVGLSDRFYFWRGFEFIVGSLGGIFTVYIFGAIYYNDAYKGAKLLILEQGLYTGDWGAFGAFVAAPVGGLLWGFGALALRLTYQYIMTRVKGHRFDALDRPVAPSTDDDDVPEDEEPTVQREVVKPNAAGKFF